MTIQENILLAPHTVFKIGGPARYFCEVKNADGLREALTWAGDHVTPFFILGAGSNVLASDEGFAGLVIKMNLRTITISGTSLMTDAGASMAQVVGVALQYALGGFEWAIGIPGTVGGSVFGNAGCFGSEMKDVVAEVEFLDTSTMTLQKYRTSACQFSYRNSIFKAHPEWVILNATINLKKTNVEESRANVLSYTKKRTSTQDIGAQCAGCIFKNPPIVIPGMAMSAGQLIDQAGLKSISVGAAMVSPTHANYIVNTGGAKASDVRALISLIKEKVKAVHGIELKEEVRYI